jgi:hypothetical protein
MSRVLLSSVFALAVATGLAVAAEMKSGPQKGEKIPGPFNPLNVTGEDAGQKRCLVCKNGDNPVVMIFARCADCPMTAKLIKAVDKATEQNSKCDMGSFVVFCTDEDKTEAKLKDMANKEGLKKIILSIDNPAGPKGYNVDKDADVTVVLYNNRKIEANYAFKKGEIKDKDIEAVIKDVAKITPAK